jgi:hypothetical protein
MGLFSSDGLPGPVRRPRFSSEPAGVYRGCATPLLLCTTPLLPCTTLLLPCHYGRWICPLSGTPVAYVGDSMTPRSCRSRPAAWTGRQQQQQQRAQRPRCPSYTNTVGIQFELMQVRPARTQRETIATEHTLSELGSANQGRKQGLPSYCTTSAATRACTTSAGSPVSHADPDPPQFRTAMGVAPAPHLFLLRSWQYPL